jgi:hypothetical protein
VDNILLQGSSLVSSGTGHVVAFAENFLTIVILTGLMIGFSYRSGRGGIISLLAAFYAGYCIYLVFPYTNFIINLGGIAILKAVLSVVLFVIATIPPFIFFQRLVGGGFGVLSFVPRFVLSFLGACFLLALAYHVFNFTHIYSFPGPINSVFAPDQYFFLWFIAPLLGLLFLIH